MPQPAVKVKTRVKNPVPWEKKSSVGPEKEVGGYCVPQWFLESVAALEPFKGEAIEDDDIVTDRSLDTLAQASNNQESSHNDDPA